MKFLFLLIAINTPALDACVPGTARRLRRGLLWARLLGRKALAVLSASLSAAYSAALTRGREVLSSRYGSCFASGSFGHNHTRQAGPGLDLDAWLAPIAGATFTTNVVAETAPAGVWTVDVVLMGMEPVDLDALAAEVDALWADSTEWVLAPRIPAAAALAASPVGVAPASGVSAEITALIEAEVEAERAAFADARASEVEADYIAEQSALFALDASGEPMPRARSKKPARKARKADACPCSAQKATARKTSGKAVKKTPRQPAEPMPHVYSWERAEMMAHAVAA